MKTPKKLKTVRKSTIAARKPVVADREEPILQRKIRMSDELQKTFDDRSALREARTRDVRELRGIVKSPSFCAEGSRGRLPKIVYCDCNMFDPAIEDVANALCGCGKQHLRLYRDDVIHWRGKHWSLECAFRFAASIVPTTKIRRLKPTTPARVSKR